MVVNISPWDFALVAGVTAQATVLAYLYHPKWKALALSLPIPFTLATLSLNMPVDATNVLGMSLLLLFTHGVRILHYRLKLPIVLSITISAALYCLIGAYLVRIVPRTNAFFWAAFALTIIFGLLFYILTPERKEPGHRSPMAIWAKILAIAAVVSTLVVIKIYLRGFMTMFPMVGVVAAYEARSSLWTICRQIPVIMLTIGPMICAIYLLQSHLTIGLSLIIGWTVCLIPLFFFSRKMWTKNDLHDTNLQHNALSEGEKR